MSEAVLLQQNGKNAFSQFRDLDHEDETKFQQHGQLFSVGIHRCLQFENILKNILADFNL